MSLLNWKRGLRRLPPPVFFRTPVIPTLASVLGARRMVLDVAQRTCPRWLDSSRGRWEHPSLRLVSLGLYCSSECGIDREEDERVKTIRDSGLRHVFNARSVGIKAEYDDRLATAHEAIDIMGFGLRHLREDHDMHFEDWAKRATVRILVLRSGLSIRPTNACELERQRGTWWQHRAGCAEPNNFMQGPTECRRCGFRHSPLSVPSIRQLIPHRR